MKPGIQKPSEEDLNVAATAARRFQAGEPPSTVLEFLDTYVQRKNYSLKDLTQVANALSTVMPTPPISLQRHMSDRSLPNMGALLRDVFVQAVATRSQRDKLEPLNRN